MGRREMQRPFYFKNKEVGWLLRQEFISLPYS